MRTWRIFGALLLVPILATCTQEAQNKIARGFQNWTGTDGVLDVVSEGKVMYRWIKIDKLSTATATGSGGSGDARDYRFGWGVLDTNFNYKVDPGEKKVYFEVSSHSNYVFYENPGN